MEQYYLFLDELKPNDVHTHFCLGGCIIEDMMYRKTIIPYMQGLKSTIFNNPNKILHESETNENNRAFWDGMRQLFTIHNITILCVAIDSAKYRTIYKDKCSVASSEYYVALQIILENYVHFLVENNGKGSVYIESRGLDEDFRLQQQYDHIRACGTLFMPSEIFGNRLFTISFPMKADNNIGIQVADFIPNPVSRHFSNIPQKPYGLFAEIANNAYDGNKQLVDRFGIKKVL